MHPEEIKAKIRMKGTTPSALADDLGINRTTVSQVIYGKCRSARVEQAISKLIGLPVSAIWTERAPRINRKLKAATARRAAA